MMGIPPDVLASKILHYQLSLDVFDTCAPGNVDRAINMPQYLGLKEALRLTFHRSMYVEIPFSTPTSDDNVIRREREWNLVLHKIVMKRCMEMSTRYLCLVMLAVMLFTAPTWACGGSVICVNAAAAPGGNGQTWGTAYNDLQTAMAAASSGTEIWVVEGIYYPDEGAGQTDNDRNATFNLMDGVAVYGGFAGTETERTERNWETHVTVLSGDIEQNDLPFAPAEDSDDDPATPTQTDHIIGDNAYNVVTSFEVSTTTILDGVTVTAGYADGSSCPGPWCGGGMLNYNQFGPTSTPTVTHVVFSGNYAAYDGGGVLNWKGDPELIDVTFAANYASSGGGMATLYSDSLTLTNVVFEQNTAGRGGGLYAETSDMVLEGCLFTNNTAGRGGGFYKGPGYDTPSGDSTLTDVSFTGNHATDTTGVTGYCNGGGGMGHIGGGSVTMTRVTFQDNTSNRHGAGLYLDNNDGSAVLNDVSFLDNQSQYHGAGLYNANNHLTLTAGSFTGNIASGHGDGGGVHHDSGQLVLTDSTFTQNTGRLGGGLCICDGDANLTGITFENNSATSSGGGLSTSSTPVVEMTDIEFTGNSAPYGGGFSNTAISTAVQMDHMTFIRNTATTGDGGGLNNQGLADITNVTFYGNTAQKGGGLRNYHNDGATIANALFVGNSATQYGGGVYNEYASLTLSNSSFSKNSAGSSGGGMYNYYFGTTATFHNCILWDDTAPSGKEIFPTTLTVTYSLVHGVYSGTGNINQDPLFVQPPSPGTDGLWGTEDDDYGDLGLTAVSPAIDAGDNNMVPTGVTTDINGDPRFVDVEYITDTGNGTPPIVDMGACEAENLTTYTLTYMAGDNGTIDGESPQTMPHGGSGTEVIAVPDEGYHFVQWDDGVMTASRTDSNVTGNITVTAEFAINTYTLTYTAGAGGTITGTSPQTVSHGSDGTAVEAVPNTGYHFVQWSDGSTTNSRTDTNVTADISVTAEFAINTYTLTYTAGANGSITGSSPQTVVHGANGTAVTAVPNTGYHFVQWSDGSTANPRTDTNVTANISVTATFAVTQPTSNSYLLWTK